MKNIINNLEKIRKAIGNKEEDISNYSRQQLSKRIQKQYSIATDIQEILSYKKDGLQYEDRRHRMGRISHEYFQKHEYIDMEIQRNKEIDIKEISELNQTRKEIFEAIDSFYQIDEIQLSMMKKQFLPIIKGLKSFNGNIQDPNFLESIEQQKAILDNINKIIKNGFQSKATAYYDRIHRLRGKMEIYEIRCQRLINHIKEGENFKERGKEVVSTTIRNNLEIIQIIKSLDTINIDLKIKTNIEDVILHIPKKFKNGEIDIEDGGYILCSDRVFNAIIDELSENYRKYGTDGYITAIIKENKLVITLTNKKKEKNPEDFSSGTGTKIFQEYMQELGGSFEGKYDTEDCITTISLPLTEPAPQTL